MQLRTKKIIAREFLIAITCLFISLLYFLGILIYNYRLDTQIKDVLEERDTKSNLIDSLSVPFKKKLENQEWFYNESEKKVIQDKYKSSESTDKLWERLSYLNKADSIIYKWNNVWKNDVKDGLREIGFKDGKAFNLFIEQNSLNNKERDVYDEIISIKKEINSLNEKSSNIEQKKIEYDQQVESTLQILLLLTLVGFPIRYFLYAIRWSYRILKKKE